MPSIVYSPSVSKMFGRNYWYLGEDVQYTINNDRDTYEFLIERGYLTDGATVPRLLWSIVPLWDECALAVVAHDFLCNYGWVVKNGKLTKLERAEIDKLFLHLLDFSNVAKFKYWMMYIAVRVFATTSGHKDPSISRRKEDAQTSIRHYIDLQNNSNLQ